MLLVEREAAILAYVNTHGVATVRELTELCDVTEVTIRRDLKRMESLNLVERTHGGVISIESPPEKVRRIAVTQEESQSSQADALIITPTQNRAVHTLRERALRNQIPLIAESVPQEGAIYLGGNNYQGAYDLGYWTGETIQNAGIKKVNILDITLKSLPNTRERSAGFAGGVRSVLGDHLEIVSLDGRGLYNDAYQIATDALRIHPEINVIFGINDDSVLGGIQAYIDLGRDPDQLIAVGIGGEGKTIFDALMLGGPLKAVSAMFPEIVGRLAVDAIAHLWGDGEIEGDIITPMVVITPDNIREYYRETRPGWEFILDSVDAQVRFQWLKETPQNIGRHISFLILYRTHEWYQNVARAMAERAREIGATFSVEDINDDIRAEIRELRRLIGKLAASYVEEGDKIILDSGSTTTFMAHFLKGFRDLTVITNSYEVFQNIRTDPNIKLTLTGGDFDRESQSFVGRGPRLLLGELRADKAFIIAGGLSSSFGVSSLNEAEAEVRRSMIQAAREVIVLADHTVFDSDSHIRVTDLGNIDTVITDAGILSAHRLELTQQGKNVLIAGGYQPNRIQAFPEK